MTAVIPLGTFDRVALRDAWPTEDGNFTPWLAGEETISLLGDALNLELEVEAVEHWVGPFRADILARAIDTEADHRVIIENQFGKTNHGHLGQILTYLSGIEHAKTVVWKRATCKAVKGMATPGPTPGIGSAFADYYRLLPALGLATKPIKSCVLITLLVLTGALRVRRRRPPLPPRSASTQPSPTTTPPGLVRAAGGSISPNSACRGNRLRAEREDQFVNARSGGAPMRRETASLHRNCLPRSRTRPKKREFIFPLPG